MPKCPKCRKKIDFLTAVVKERNFYNYGGEGSFVDQRDCFEQEVEYWKCPLCFEHLEFPDMDDADAFLSKAS